MFNVKRVGGFRTDFDLAASKKTLPTKYKLSKNNYLKFLICIFETPIPRNVGRCTPQYFLTAYYTSIHYRRFSSELLVLTIKTNLNNNNIF